MKQTILSILLLLGFPSLLLAQQAGAGKPQEKFKGPIKVFILAGQSNMEGQGVVSLDGERDYNGGKGNLVWSMKNSKSAGKMKCLKNEKGEWVVRGDVQISFKVGDKVRKGGLTVGYTGYGGSSHIGPELGFGFVMGDYFEEPVLLIKTAWGGKSLYVDFRPPSSGGQVGPFYTKMVEEVRAALVELGDQKYEIAGFVWQQGWNDMCTKPAIPEYAQNLVNLVNDLREEFNVPDMPVVVGELGNGGPVTEGDMFEFRKAQEQGTKRIKNARLIKTTDFARPPEVSPNTGHGHHWYGNAESYFLIGDALGKGMVKLLDAKDYPIKPVRFADVHIEDSFWSPRLAVNRTATVPAVLKQCEATGIIDNFAKAAGLMPGSFRANPWDDSVVGTSLSAVFNLHGPQIDSTREINTRLGLRTLDQ